MADQGSWFKLWIGADDDPDLGNFSLQDFARWCKFGLYLKKYGTSGTVQLTAPCRALQHKFELSSFDEIIDVIRRFPNCIVKGGETIVTVTWSNWHKYQADTSGKSTGGLVKEGGVWRSAAEHEFAKILREIGVEFKQQQRFPHAKTFYTVDFYLAALNLAFEINGPEHSTTRYKELDRRKKDTLYRVFQVVVIAISSDSITNNKDFTKRYVIDSIESLSSHPLRREEKRSEEKRIKNHEPPSAAPSVDSKHEDKKPGIEPIIKQEADRIYAIDPKRFARLIQWINGARRNYSPVVIADSLKKFLPFARDETINWWGYLDKILDKTEALTNARNSENESEQFKLKDKQTADALFSGFRVGTQKH